MKRNNLQEEMFSQLRVKDLFEQAKSFAYEYMDDINDRNVFPKDEAIKNLSAYDEALPMTPGDPDEILQMLHKYGSRATVAQTGGRYFGFVNSGAGFSVGV